MRLRGYRGNGRKIAGQLIAALLLVAGCVAQDQHPVTKREIAPVMGMGGADWLTRPERQVEERPTLALDEIGIAPGSTVADIGAGVGFYTALLAERVGPLGRVYANEIQPGMLDLLRHNMAQKGLTNVIPVLGTESDPKLPPDTLDLALLVDVYHELSAPQAMLRGLRKSLKQNGRLVLLEYRAEDPKVPIRPEHKMSVKQVKAELEPEGFHLVKRSEKLPWQHILVWGKS